MTPTNIVQELQDAIINKISEGMWTPGKRIPSERQLAQAYKVSRATVRKAIANLTEQGVLVSVPGSGTYVSTKSKRTPSSRTIAFLVCTRGNLSTQSPRICFMRKCCAESNWQRAV